jgi:hypothetical protein
MSLSTKVNQAAEDNPNYRILKALVYELALVLDPNNQGWDVFPVAYVADQVRDRVKRLIVQYD